MFKGEHRIEGAYILFYLFIYENRPLGHHKVPYPAPRKFRSGVRGISPLDFTTPYKRQYLGCPGCRFPGSLRLGARHS